MKRKSLEMATTATDKYSLNKNDQMHTFFGATVVQDLVYVYVVAVASFLS